MSAKSGSKPEAGNGVYPSNAGPAITRTVAARLPTDEGDFYLYHYTNTRDHKEHLALVCGDVREGEGVLTRVHSECFTGDVLGSRRCDCGGQLHRAMELIADAGRGVVIYLRQEGRGIGLAAKLRAYNLQDEGYDTVEANLLLGHQADEREYWAAAAILADLRVRSVNLLTNNPDKIEHLWQLGVRVDGRTPIVAEIHADNHAYLATKVQRMRHMLDLPTETDGRTSSAETLSQVGDVFPLDVNGSLARLRARVEARPAFARPFVTLTYAQSINGAISGPDGAHLVLSGDASMRLTHTLRGMHDAILVGIGTVLKDDPRLTVRLADGPQPLPVVLDTTLRTPRDAKVMAHPRGVLIASTVPEPARRATLAGSNAEVLELPATETGQVDLPALLDLLAARGVRSVMVEGGAKVIREFLRLHLVDAVVVTVAPRFVEGTPALGPSAETVGPLPGLRDVTYTPLGKDLVLWAMQA